MSGVDVVARTLARAAAGTAARQRTLATLRRSIARVGGRLPAVIAVPPTISSTGDSGTPAGFTHWLANDDTGDVHAGKYSFVGGAWRRLHTAFPFFMATVGYSSHGGDGTDPLANPQDGGRIRFASFAPKLEIGWQANQGGYRLKVDGEYVQAGPLTVTAGTFTYTMIQWGDGGDAHRRLRHYEIELAGNARFVGTRSATACPPMPWPVEDHVRMLVHGDSMVDTVDDLTAATARLHGDTAEVIANLCGQPDCWSSGVGGAGWIADTSGTRSRCNDRVATDVIAPRPDVIWEMGGKNDVSASGMTQAGLQALVEDWLARVTAALPDVIVFMTGPIASNGGQNATAPALQVAAAKAAAAARFARNVRYLDNIGGVAPWMTGSGRQGMATGDGIADWATGPDGTHPTADGHVLQARRFVAGAVAALADWH